MDLMENRDCLDLLETEESLEKMGLLEFRDYLETRVPQEAKVLQDYKDTKALPENKEIQGYLDRKGLVVDQGHQVLWVPKESEEDEELKDHLERLESQDFPAKLVPQGQEE